MKIEGVPGNHRVACHFAEQIASGEIQPHEVKAVVTDQTGDSSDEAGSMFEPEKL